ncbi:MAG: hypothetical protein QF473_16965, partial [Planctomycetota bacterium]|nr:hypothetical protein [Planctomycetota bacterium]
VMKRWGDGVAEWWENGMAEWWNGGMVNWGEGEMVEMECGNVGRGMLNFWEKPAQKESVF